MAKKRKIYECISCGTVHPIWEGRCSQCGEWGSLEEKIQEQSQGQKKIVSSKSAKKLVDTSVEQMSRIKSSYRAWDTVLGDGLVKDSVTILTARPGAGKSTLLLQMAQNYGAKGFKVLYASGEESSSQIKSRANRLFDKISENIWLLASNDIDEVEAQINEIDADLFIIDSIQTFRSSEHSQRAGTPVQTISCTEKILELAKNSSKPRAALVVGHMTKTDEMAGLRTLEHMVDTVLLLEGDDVEELRILRSTKNRFGATGEIGLFEMKEKGLMEVDNPSLYFTTDREEGVIGSAKTLLREGTRMLIIEIESLVSTSFTPYPMRISESMPRDRLNTLLSILEERAGLRLSDKNVIVKTTGNIKLTEPAADLAVLISIASSVLNKPVPIDGAFIGEVGLTGELKKVSHFDRRIRELKRLGYKNIYTAPGSKEKEMKTVKETVFKVLK